MDMVEKVALALYVEARPEGWSKDKATEIWLGSPIDRDKPMRQARAAIEAMLIPSERMTHDDNASDPCAGQNVPFLRPETLEYIYTKMIDAALETEK